MTDIKTEIDALLLDYPVYEYRILASETVPIEERVRQICRQECSRYGTTWACPPAVGTIRNCQEIIRQYPYGLFFSSVAEVRDIMDMEELLSTRKAHEDITDGIGSRLKEKGLDIHILSTESCDICKECTYPLGKPCRFPSRMHPCLESYGVVVSRIVEMENMEYQLGGNTVLWFSLILFRESVL